MKVELRREYLEWSHRPVREQGLHAHIFDRSKTAYLSDDMLAGGERSLDEAERLADNDAVRFRVQVARLPIWYVKIATDRVTGNERADPVRRFLGIARKAGISNISEGKSIDDWAKQMGPD